MGKEKHQSAILCRLNDQPVMVDTIAINRKMEVIIARDNFDFEDNYLNPKNYNLDKLYLELPDQPSFEAAFTKARLYVNPERLNRQFPPACVYKGFGKNFLPLDRIITFYNKGSQNISMQIDWDRVRSNAPSRDSSLSGSDSEVSVNTSFPRKISLGNSESLNSSSKTVQTSISEGSELPGMQKSVGIANNGKTAMSGEQRARKIRKNLEAVDQEKPRYARHTESSLAKTGHASPAFYKHKKNSKTQPWK